MYHLDWSRRHPACCQRQRAHETRVHGLAFANAGARMRIVDIDGHP